MFMISSYLRLPSQFFELTSAEPVTHPELLFFNHSLAKTLRLNIDDFSSSDLAFIFSGQKLLQDSTSLALAYSGHQFGHFNPSLGDGRALLLGEMNGFDIQLKGSGRTRYSRRGDGKSALGPVIREMILSEAMHALQIPTTRALAAVGTGEKVYRETLLSAGIYTRVAKSHLRIGTFEYAKIQNNKNLLIQLTQYAIERLYPEMKSDPDQVLLFFKKVSQNYLKLVNQWLGVGFIHGVMNTDNAAISGETLDYGPCAFMDEFSFDRHFSSIDENGRYRYQAQPHIALWNLSSLAHCLSELIHPDANEVKKILESEFHKLEKLNRELWICTMGNKLGILLPEEKDFKLIHEWLTLLETHHLDFTQAHFKLNEILVNDLQVQNHFFPAPFSNFFKLWKERIRHQNEIETLIILLKVNPIYIPRNHLVENAIVSAYEGNMQPAFELMKVLENPFQLQKGKDAYLTPPGVEQRNYRTFCGT